ncbi:MAG: NRDE family protein [Deltaproteobacteria bacterium]|nr:NRDE family protein [Deltaproteobacteria bacterium]
MCTLAIYVRSLPGFPLVIAANRDEFLDREATGPALLATAPRAVGGRDLRAGGTWLAISADGVVAGILNRRTGDWPVPTRRSRGELPLAALAAGSAGAARPVIGALRADAYNAFNLLVADREEAWVAQNHGDDMRVTRLAPGLHLVSNLDVDDPTCPKLARSHVRFAAAGEAFVRVRDVVALRTALHAIVADHALALDPRLPDALGAICVHAGPFGTRSSSLLLLDDAGRWEHWFADGPPCARRYEPALVP